MILVIEGVPKIHVLSAEVQDENGDIKDDIKIQQVYLNDTTIIVFNGVNGTESIKLECSSDN